MNIPKTRVRMLLEIDREQKLRELHKAPYAQSDTFGLKKTLASRIKEIKRMIVAGEAGYK